MPSLTAEDLALMALLVMPQHLLHEVRSGGGTYSWIGWETGLNGTNYQPDTLGCDWLIRHVRDSTGTEPTIKFLREIESIIRAKPEQPAQPA